MSSFLKGENLSLNLSVLIASLLVVAVYQQVCMKSSSGDDEETPKWKKYVMYSLVGSTALLAIPVVYGVLYPKKSASALPSVSSFEERVAEASNSLRQSLEEPKGMDIDTPSTEEFQKRVNDAAEALRAQIAASPPAAPSMPKEQTASSLAAQASAEISRFIEENS